MTMNKTKIHLLILVLLVVIQYGNTLFLNYALDDRLVIFQNDYTLKGFDGVKEVMTEDSFSGYFGKMENMVSGGRYRPLTQLTFILEYEIFGGKIKEQVGLGLAPQNESLFIEVHLPFVSHLINLILYILLVILVYYTLKILFAKIDQGKWYLSLPFIATLIFALHPLHTEAVANIKGRDEILSMLGGVLTVWSVLKYVEKRKIPYLILSFFAMLFGIFSKENAITFVAVIPLALYFSHFKIKKKDWAITVIPSLLSVAIFLIMRTIALGEFMPADTSHNILNDPFLNSTAFQKIATVILTWGIYLKLMIFPHPLTHDYYPKQIEITDFSNPVVWLLLAFFIFIVYYALKKLKSKEVISFGILFFMITFSIVSNLLFSVGTFMNERFLFAPLLGFAIILAHYLLKLADVKSVKFLFPVLIGFFLGFYVMKGVVRNQTWKDDFTLFTTDVKVSSNSIKCNVSAGGSYLQRYKRERKEKDFRETVKYLNKAVELDRFNYYAHSLLGETYYMKKEYVYAVQYFKNASAIQPENMTAKSNLDAALVAVRSSGIESAEEALKNGNPEEAMTIINGILAENPQNAKALNLKGKIFGMGMNQIDSALVYLNRALEIEPDFISALENAGVAYALKRDYEKALHHLLKAYELTADNQSIIQNIIFVYRNKNDLKKTAEWEAKLSSLSEK